MLVDKIRTAAGAKLRRSLRLRDRVRHRIGQAGTVAGSVATRPRTQPRPTQSPRPSATAAPSGIPGLILVGASTGGPPAIEAILSSLPADFPWPVLIAQHLPASFTGAFAKRLDALCAIRVGEVASPTPLRPGRAYIGRGDADIVVAPRAAGPVAMSAPAHRDYPWHPSVERLVTSALEVFPAARLVGVLLSGMGDDGADAMTRLKAEGGRTIAESQATAVVWGMPGELVKNGGAGVVAPLGEIGTTIVDMVM
jgi:two-component system chemotaxis response regulator CheB